MFDAYNSTGDRIYWGFINVDCWDLVDPMYIQPNLIPETQTITETVTVTNTVTVLSGFSIESIYISIFGGIGIGIIVILILIKVKNH
ncbi:MAG: hypothetical protein E3J86_14090 [Candidatus Thorarchaeota archaeon]|nr:MAG: hypothetical protein E3J86_14090 [Candidatus Thorarchaeota archaeon]